MKPLYLILILLFEWSCAAQSPILPLFNNARYGDTNGAYYKDLDNDFDKFTGTWILTNGTTSLKITLQKVVQIHNAALNIYSDMLVGDYRYIENGVEKVNTLSQLSATNVYAHNIYGGAINLGSSFPICNDCAPTERRVLLSFTDPTRAQTEGLEGEIILRRADVGTTQKIRLWLRQTGNVTYTEDNPPLYNALNLPWGEYVLTKQP